MNYYDYSGFRPHVTAAARRARAARELAKLRKNGRTISPIAIEGRTIARTFWGKAWCDNLERYSDYANRLPRGRSYVRNGSVVDLQVGPGVVTALVSGSAMYDVRVAVGAVPRASWSAICSDCSGAIDSLVELLEGHLASGVMTRLSGEKGLFPSPKDIRFRCSCPDWASMCKHVAAVLYGVGARLDQQPELLFTLRKVDQQDLIVKAGSDLAKRRRGPARAKVLAGEDLSEMFGIEMAPSRAPSTRRARAAAAAHEAKPSAAPPSAAPKRAKAIGAAESTEPATRAREKGRRTTPAKRLATAERLRTYWAARRDRAKKPDAR